MFLLAIPETPADASGRGGMASRVRVDARFFFVKELRVHACSLLRSPEIDVATGGNAK